MNEALAEKLRLLMQLRTLGIRDTRILSAIEAVPRERFVPRMFQDRAYADEALPIEAGQTIGQPRIVAAIASALEIGERDHVLEVGAGAGYQSAVLSRLALRVYGIERQPELALLASERLRNLDFGNITIKAGDGIHGWPEVAPFDRIVVSASAIEVPAALSAQLKENGILVMPVGSPNAKQMLTRFRKRDGVLASDELMPVSFLPLIAGKVPS